MPYYVRRSLEGYPARTPLAGLAQGYEAMASSLPPGSPVLLLALSRLAQRAQQLLLEYGSGGSREQLQRPGLDLIRLYAHLALIIDFQVCVFHAAMRQVEAPARRTHRVCWCLACCTHCIILAKVLPEALDLLEAAVRAVPREVAVDACSCIEEVLASTDDYTRKSLFVRWYMRLAAACAP